MHSGAASEQSGLLVLAESKEPTPAPIQVVFQGGGAKLCLLMAVCEVLKKYEADKLIEIRRVAGSSAGAIAAVMLASDKPISTYIAELKSLAQVTLLQIETAQWLGAWRVFRGRAFFKGFELENFFNELFCKKGAAQKLSELRIKGTKVYFTDLYSLASVCAADDEAIPKAWLNLADFHLPSRDIVY
jgi:predicted acylesterase/phospholipase RssA